MAYYFYYLFHINNILAFLTYISYESCQFLLSSLVNKSGKHVYALDQMPVLQSKMKLKLPQLVSKSADTAFPWEQTNLLSLYRVL